MRAVRFCTACLMLALCMTGMAEAETRPRFLWATFQFFWNKNAVMGSEIVASEPVAGGYHVTFAPATSMFVRMDGDFVTEVQLRFGYVSNENMNGRAFLRAQESLLRVGMYRWPPEMANAVKERFSQMTPGRIVHQWRTSYFERQQLANGNWLFTLKFIDDLKN